MLVENTQLLALAASASLLPIRLFPTLLDIAHKMTSHSPFIAPIAWLVGFRNSGTSADGHLPLAIDITSAIPYSELRLQGSSSWVV